VELSRAAATETTTGRPPFYQWSSKGNGKTVTRTLSQEVAKLHREWIESDLEASQNGYTTPRDLTSCYATFDA
jgi:hypothetical protein